jgi:hypothetical protein
MHGIEPRRRAHWETTMTKKFAVAIFALFCGFASASVASAHGCHDGYSSGGYNSYSQSDDNGGYDN